MKLALIADVHANLPALDAVIADMPQVDAILCAGDVVGYYADPDEVCHRLRELGAWVIRGNHDAYVTGQLEPDPARRAAYRTDWTRGRLGPENLAWLSALPVEMTFCWGGARVQVRHANPWDEELYLYPDSETSLRRIALDPGEFLVVGHTHRPMTVRCGAGLLINPGSVGQPRDWSPLAAYAIFDTHTEEVVSRRVAYDTATLQGRLTAGGWDPSVVSILSRTR